MKRFPHDQQAEVPEAGFEGVAEAKKWLKRMMGTAQPKFDEVWRQLINRQVDMDAIDGAISRDEFLEEARELAKTKAVQRKDRRRSALRKPRKVIEYRDLTDLESIRAEALAEYFARLGDRYPPLIKLRKRLNDGAPLDPTQAFGLLNSQAARILKLRDFIVQGVPLLNHDSTLRVRPVLMKKPSSSHDSEVEVQLKWRGGTARQTASLSRRKDKSAEIQWLATPVPRSYIQSIGWISVWPESVLDEVREVAEALARGLPWEEPDATWFVLTGVAPTIEPFTVVRESNRNGYVSATDDPADAYVGYRFSEITLRVQSWVSPESVENVYRHRSGRRGESAQGHVSRSSNSRTVKLFLFVVSEARKSGRRPNWGRLLSAWNAQCPIEWRYPSLQQLRTAYIRGKAAIVFDGSDELAKQAPD